MADRGAHFLSAVTFVLDDLESASRPPLVQLPRRHQGSADVQSAVDEHRWQMGDHVETVEDAVLAEKRVVGPGMRDLQGEPLAELRIPLGKAGLEGRG